MKKELLILKRKKAKELHEKGFSNRKIARHLLASKDSVGKWVQMNDRRIAIDNRGWKKGKSRKYTPEAKQQIMKNIRICVQTIPRLTRKALSIWWILKDGIRKIGWLKTSKHIKLFFADCTAKEL